MVQYIFTPWRDQHELLSVRQQFYPRPPSEAHHHQSRDTHLDDDDAAAEAELRGRQQAVSRVAMWMHRGGCPHVVESTALLTAAVLMDQAPRRGRAGEDATVAASGEYAVRAAYATAFSRFVTGLLDSHQDKQRKMSMYAIAKSVGLPATFVELRHQATHEQLPSLTKLRSAARKALAWVWEYYWQHLSEPEKLAAAAFHGARWRIALDGKLVAVLTTYMDEDDAARREQFARSIRKMADVDVLQALDQIMDSTGDTKLLLRLLELYKAVLRTGPLHTDATEAQRAEGEQAKDIECVKAELSEGYESLKRLENALSRNGTGNSDGGDLGGPGWSRFRGKWIPKPIGMV